MLPYQDLCRMVHNEVAYWRGWRAVCATTPPLLRTYTSLLVDQTSWLARTRSYPYSVDCQAYYYHRSYSSTLSFPKSTGRPCQSAQHYSSSPWPLWGWSRELSERCANGGRSCRRGPECTHPCHQLWLSCESWVAVDSFRQLERKMRMSKAIASVAYFLASLS